MTFTTLNNNASLASLSPAGTIMAPAFDKGTTDYIATVSPSTTSLEVTVTSEDPRASVTVGGIAAGQGGGTVSVNVPFGSMKIPVVVTAEDGVTTRNYLLVATRLPDMFTFDSATDVPVVAHRFLATGQTANFALNFQPSPGTRLTVVDNLSLDFIIGTFGNLAQGQELVLTYQGTGYRFVADYFGGSGNDLVLHWADNTAFAWGSNSYGQLGSGSGEPASAMPVEIGQSSLLKGKTILALSTGYLHSLALCSDGSLAAWGYNVYGQLGNGGTTLSGVPVAVDSSGALAGRTVIAISAGPFHNLALCSDGGVVAWGYNNYGQLGDGTTTTSPVPVAVQRIGALAGKTVIAVAAGAYHSFALCSDGGIAAWGYNDEGELGNGGNTGSLQPVAVGGVLSGKTVVSMAAGLYHAIALCPDGTVAAWGYNHRGQLGTGGTTDSPLPVQIAGSGALSGRVVSAVSASGSHSLAICSDGTLAAWGLNSSGQLGDGTTTDRLVPVIVDHSGILAGKSVVAIAAGIEHSLATCADGTLAAWGSNRDGRLGHPGPASSSMPVEVSPGALPNGSIAVLGSTGSSSSHGLAIVALPHATPAPLSFPETTAQSVGPSALETWRQTHFGQLGSEIDSSDLADPDHDGIVNLIEYAFALDPKRPSAGQLPQWRRIGNELVISFTEPPGVTGITYGAKTSIALEGEDWLPIVDTGTAPQHIFRVPIDRTSRFVRLEVTSGRAD
jgi:alpha-tubulin suppressor-like RCC1 family protein